MNTKDAKQFISSARRIDEQIAVKIQQAERLKEQAQAVTSAVSGMPAPATSERSKIAHCIDKMVDMQAEIDEQIVELVEIKKRVSGVISRVDDVNLRLLLEKRYICCDSWEEIAQRLRYDYYYTRKKLHSAAIAEVQKILDKET